MKRWERLFEVGVGTTVALAFVAIAVLLGVIAVRAQSGEDAASGRAAALEQTVQGLQATSTANHQEIGELLADVAALDRQLQQLGVPPVIQIQIPPGVTGSPGSNGGTTRSPTSSTTTTRPAPTTTTTTRPGRRPCTTVPVLGPCVP